LIEKVDDLESEIFFVGKIEIKGPFGDPGRLEHFLDTGMVVSLVVDDPGAGLNDFLLGILFLTSIR
jgi:hypothetical protein